MPAGVHSYDVIVSDSLKGFWLSTSGNLLTAPVNVSANVLVPSSAAHSTSVGAFTYVVSQVPFAPEAIPTVIIPQDSIHDDGYLSDVPLGFNFDFYGNTYSKVNVYSNGFLQFGLPQADPFRAGFFRGDAIPSTALPNNIIAFAWTDWSPQLVYGGIRYETRGTAPNRRFLLQFNNVPAFQSPTGLLMMQLVLTEGSNIITIYTNTMHITSTSQRITQGIENIDGTAAAFDSVQNPVNGVWSPRVRNLFSLTKDAVQFAPPSPPVVTAPKDTTVPTTPPAVLGAGLALGGSPALGSCVATVNVGVATATDNVGVVSLVGIRSDNPTLPLDAPYPKGVTTITWTATNTVGMTASATQRVTVVDKENPWLAAPAGVSAVNDPHLPSAVVSVGSAQAADNCPDVKVSSVRSDGAAITAPFMVGETTINWTATDASGNTTSASQSIKVRDVEPPTLTVPASVMVSATSPSGAAVTFQLNASDNVAVTSLTCTRASGATFPIGTTSVTCTAADAAGNSTSGTFDVTVLDAPTQMSNLIHYVLGLGMPSGTTNPLVNQLQAAFGSSTSDNHVACVKMSDFISMVGKKGRDIPSGSSNYMTAQATQIMVVLACPTARLHPPVGLDGTTN
jgi:HYR domain